MNVGPLNSGPIDLATGASLPEITEVQRLTLKPGDRLVVHTDEKLTVEQFYRLREIVRANLEIPDDVPLIILSRGMSLEVVEEHAGA